MNILGIDIGGSAVKGAPVDTLTGRLLAERFRVESKTGLGPVRMARAVAEIAGHFEWKGPVGLGFPGVVQGSRILTAANLPRGYAGRDGAALFRKALGRRASVVNDAAAAALAEMRFGAGRGFKGKVLVLTLGTGIGSALCYRGTVIPCELGHLPLNGAIAEKSASSSARKRLELSWEEWGRRLSVYIGVLEQVLWPELIIIGGGVSAKHEKFFKYVETKARLVPARLLNEAGIVGAALWAAADLPEKKG